MKIRPFIFSFSLLSGTLISSAFAQEEKSEPKQAAEEAKKEAPAKPEENKNVEKPEVKTPEAAAPAAAPQTPVGGAGVPPAPAASAPTKDAGTTPPKTEAAKTPPPKKEYDADTPETIKDKLTLGLGIGLGAGSGSDLAMDRASYSFHGLYTVHQIPEMDLDIRANILYLSFFGVQKDKDLSSAVQNFLWGAEGLKKVDNSPWSFGGAGFIGFQHITQVNQTSWKNNPSSNSLSVAASGRAYYRFYKKLSLVHSVNLVVGKAKWFDASIGVNGDF